MIEYDKGNGQRLLVGYTDDRARKDAYNREKGIRRLEKAYNRGTLTKDNINKRGYNKFLKMEGDVKVSINYDKLEADENGTVLKGILQTRIFLLARYTPHTIISGMLRGLSGYQNQK